MSDVKKSDWFAPGVSYLLDRNIINVAKFYLIRKVKINKKLSLLILSLQRFELIKNIGNNYKVVFHDELDMKSYIMKNVKQ